MSRTSHILFLLSMLSIASCYQSHSDTSIPSTSSVPEVKYEADFYIHSKDYYEKNVYHPYNELETIKLSLYHFNDLRQIEKVPYSFPQELLDMIEEPLLPLTKIRLYYDANDKVVNYALLEKSSHYFIKGTVVSKTDEDRLYDNKSLNYFDYGLGDFFFDENFNIIEKYDEYYYSSIRKLNFKFSISDDDYLNRLYTSMFPFEYIITGSDGKVAKVNNLLLGDEIYALMQPNTYPSYIYSFNPYMVSTIDMLDQGGNLFIPSSYIIDNSSYIDF